MQRFGCNCSCCLQQSHMCQCDNLQYNILTLSVTFDVAVYVTAVILQNHFFGVATSGSWMLVKNQCEYHLWI